MNTNIPNSPIKINIIPPPIKDFVGREAEIKELVKALSPSNNTDQKYGNVAVIFGQSGVGKTELARTISRRLEHLYPDAQIGVTINFDTGTLTVHHAFEAIIHALDPFARLSDSLEELQIQYHSLLEGKRILIVLEMLDCENVIPWLIPSSTCALLLITDQVVKHSAAFNMELSKLTTKSAEQLIQKINTNIGGPEASSLANCCDCTPLPLRLSTSLLASDPSIKVAEYIHSLTEQMKKTSNAKTSNETLIRAITYLTYQRLNDIDQQIFCKLGIFIDAFSLETVLALAELEGFGDQNIYDLLGKFCQLSLLSLDETTKLYRMYLPVRKFALENLSNPSRTGLHLNHLFADTAEYCATLAYQHGADGFHFGLLIFDDFKPYFKQAWASIQRQNQISPIIDSLTLKLYKNMEAFGRLRYFPENELLPNLFFALEACQRQNNQETMLSILGRIGKTYYQIGNGQKALEYYEKQLNLIQHQSNQNEKEKIERSISSAKELLNTIPQRDKRNIVLTGFMGTGKTTVGKLLASKLGREFVDTDELIETRFRKSLPKIFLEFGESSFRKMEAEIVHELAKREELVISTGGRLLLDSRNVTALSQNGRFFCLVATPEEILSRIRKDEKHPRPLLEVPNPGERIVELLQERKKGYQRFLQVKTNEKQPADVTNALLNLIREDNKRISIEHPVQPYEYIVGSGLLPFIRQLANIEGKLVVITDAQVGELYGPSCGSIDHIITLEAGKQKKTLETAQRIYDQLLQFDIDRTSTVVALGGSSIGDLVGFVSDTFMRGINFVQCPTSLLAMVDTSIGGKTGLDLPQGKNLIGGYKQPLAVIADIATLQSLPPEEFASGMAEVIKHGLLADTDLFQQVENRKWSYEAVALAPSLSEFQTLVAQAIQVKISIVQEDPFEKGQRSILNLGHTFAHAIEQVSLQTIRHGEAVAMGLVAAANLSTRLGYCSAELQERIEYVLGQVSLPSRIPRHLSPQKLLTAMSSDKKKQAGHLRFILLYELGHAFVANSVPLQAVLSTLEDVSEED